MLANARPTLDDEVAERVHALKSKQRHHERVAADCRDEAAKSEADAAHCASLLAEYKVLAQTAGLTVTATCF
jgi:phage host-nuclease inhibitor protein Gam